MWLFTKKGFLSVVQDNKDPYYLSVRARLRWHLVHLSAFSGVRIASTPDYDYPYRLRVTRPVFLKFMMENIADLNYTNFKDSIQKQNKYWDICNRIWAMLLDLERLNERIHPYLRLIARPLGSKLPSITYRERRGCRRP